jgi:hypothetical protein
MVSRGWKDASGTAARYLLGPQGGVRQILSILPREFNQRLFGVKCPHDFHRRPEQTPPATLRYVAI